MTEIDTSREAVERVIAGLNKHDPQDMEIIAPMLRSLLAENERLRRRLHRIAQPGRTIAYCQNGHEEAVLIARVTLKGAAND